MFEGWRFGRRVFCFCSFGISNFFDFSDFSDFCSLFDFSNFSKVFIANTHLISINHLKLEWESFHYHIYF